MSTELIKMLQNNCSDVIEFFDANMVLISKGDKNKRFVEKTPQHVLHLSFILEWFPNASILHIVRDGRDCYCSSKINVHIPQNSSVRVFAKYWRKCVSKPIKHSDSKRIYTIRYEDLVASPELELSKTMNFLNLNFEDSQINTSLLSKDNRAKRVEFKRLSSEINSASVNRWKKELSADEIVKFENIAGKELKYYGYEIK